MKIQTVGFDKLWMIALRESKKLGVNPGDVFYPLGLYLNEPVVENWGYSVTPNNAVTFGSTGVDGEHFSFISISGKVDKSPIVMTVPMASRGSENIIVGQDLVDFLSLGYLVSFSALPDLAYSEFSKEKLISKLVNQISGWEAEDPNDEWTVNRKYLSEVLKIEFDLRPWQNVEQKLTILKSNYYHLLAL